jgi:methionine-rich copper-binding protein CopC
MGARSIRRLTALGAVRGTGVLAVAAFARRLPAGSYMVSWRARADDGHSERGTFTFRVRR